MSLKIKFCARSGLAQDYRSKRFSGHVSEIHCCNRMLQSSMSMVGGWLVGWLVVGGDLVVPRAPGDDHENRICHSKSIELSTKYIRVLCSFRPRTGELLTLYQLLPSL